MLKIGIIGTGALGRHHTRLYKNIKDVEVIGVYDVNTETAENIAKEFSVTNYPDMNELVNKCDALSVAVPATKHYDVAVPLLKQKKHLLIEKPLAANIEEAEEMVRLANENNVVLGVGHVERFNPAMAFLESKKQNTRFIEAHRLALYPPPRPGQHRRGVEVGVVLDLMIHDIDLVLNMVDSDVEKIDAVGIPVLSTTEDIANVRIQFENGAVANLTASRISQDPTRRFRVFQNDAYISMDYGKHNGVISKKEGSSIAQEKIDLDEYNALELELADFATSVINTITTGKIVQTKVSGEQGLRALKVAVAIKAKIEEYNNKYNA